MESACQRGTPWSMYSGGRRGVLYDKHDSLSLDYSHRNWQWKMYSARDLLKPPSSAEGSQTRQGATCSALDLCMRKATCVFCNIFALAAIFLEMKPMSLESHMGGQGREVGRGLAWVRKKKLHSWVAVWVASDPWQAFLVLSVPNKALILPGASCRAASESVGPRRVRHLATAPAFSQERVNLKSWKGLFRQYPVIPTKTLLSIESPAGKFSPLSGVWKSASVCEIRGVTSQRNLPPLKMVHSGSCESNINS